MGEGVRLFIVAEIEWLSSPHEVHCVSSQADEDYLHDKEIKASPYEDKVDVPCQENYQK